MQTSQEPPRQQHRIRRKQRFRTRLWELRPFFGLVLVCLIALGGLAYWRRSKPETGANIDIPYPFKDGLSLADMHFELGETKRVIVGFIVNTRSTPARQVHLRLRLSDDHGPIDIVDVNIPHIPPGGKAHFRTAEIPDSVERYGPGAIESAP